MLEWARSGREKSGREKQLRSGGHCSQARATAGRPGLRRAEQAGNLAQLGAGTIDGQGEVVEELP
jgi:hypothetical protein